MIDRSISLLHHILWLALFLLPFHCYALSPSQAVDQIKQLAPEAGILLGEDNRVLLARHTEQLYPTASCIKIPLVLSAFNLLGDDFRFTTSFYVDQHRNLLIRGEGDPFLISEEIELIADELKERGWMKFRQLYLDGSLYKQVKIPAIGDSNNPYDAPLSSLSVNFNTMNLIRHSDNRIISAEPQTPTLDLAQTMHDEIPCCNQIVRIRVKPQDTNTYTRQLIYSIFTQQGISLLNHHQPPEQNHNWSLIYQHHNSRSLAEVSQALLLYSNNLIANSLLLQFAPTGDRILANSLTTWQANLHQYGIQDFHLVEGSGLDKNNVFSPLSMFQTLMKFIPYMHLLPSDKQGAVYKTGTLQGISNAAGYIQHGDRLRPFVIFNQQGGSYQPLLAILKQVD